jgi:hypothetical protein
MKRILILLTGLFLITLVNAQFRSAGLVVGAGYTLVDIENAIDYSPLEDWDHFAVIIKALGEYEMKPGLFLVGEIGSNRLYYWEYRWTDGYYGGTRWRSEWTTNFGISIKKMLNENVYVQAGPVVHIFNSGGTVLGLVLAAGYELPLGDQLTLPFGLRVEPVFGSGIPISLLGNTGVRYLF